MLYILNLNNINFYRKNIFKRTLHNSDKGSNKPLIRVYDINNLSLIEGARFKTKSECAKVLNINRSTITAYLDAEKLYKNKLIFSSTVLSKQELSKWVVPTKVWQIVTGEMLGDGI